MSRLDRYHPPAPFAGTRVDVGTGTPIRRLALLVALAASAAAGFLLGADPAAVAADPDLAVVLQVTAATKALIALCAAAAVDWRLRHPLAGPTAAALIAAAALALAGPALALGVTHLRTGMAVHYAGMVGLALLAWRDRAAIAAILAARAYRR